jgi:hypothetical protein
MCCTLVKTCCTLFGAGHNSRKMCCTLVGVARFDGRAGGIDRKKGDFDVCNRGNKECEALADKRKARCNLLKRDNDVVKAICSVVNMTFEAWQGYP